MPRPALVEVSPEKDLDEQYTPAAFFAPLDREFAFTLDPCATAESALVDRFYTKAEDGLAQSWAGERVWLNPPYSAITEWLGKVRHEMEHGCACVVALLPSWTDRKWWHEHIEPFRRGGRGPELRFVKGRIVFGCPGNTEGRKRSGGTFPNVLVIWRRAQDIHRGLAYES